MPNDTGTEVLAPSQARTVHVRQALALELLTIAWMAIEGTVAIWAGVVGHTVSLETFGLDSAIELLAAVALLRRLRLEQQDGCAAGIAAGERRASGGVAILLAALAVYAVAAQAWAMLHGGAPQPGFWGLAVAAAATVGMPILGRAKLRLAQLIGSEALRAEAACSLSCAGMSAALLVGLLLQRRIGAWADAATTAAITAYLLREARGAWRFAHGQSCGCCG